MLLTMNVFRLRVTVFMCVCVTWPRPRADLRFSLVVECWIYLTWTYNECVVVCGSVFSVMQDTNWSNFNVLASRVMSLLGYTRHVDPVPLFYTHRTRMLLLCHIRIICTLTDLKSTRKLHELLLYKWLYRQMSWTRIFCTDFHEAGTIHSVEYAKPVCVTSRLIHCASRYTKKIKPPHTIRTFARKQFDLNGKCSTQPLGSNIRWAHAVTPYPYTPLADKLGHQIGAITAPANSNSTQSHWLTPLRRRLIRTPGALMTHDIFCIYIIHRVPISYK